MVEQTFNASVLASAYTGFILIPESETELYQSVKPLLELMEQKAGIVDAALLSKEYQRFVRKEMNECFPKVQFQRFEAAIQAYYAKSGRGLKREAAWPHVSALADNVIHDQTVDI